MGGLELGESRESVTVRLELTAPASAATTEYTPLRHARPWQKPGWFRKNTAWLEGALNEEIERLEPVSTNDLGTVLRVTTRTRTAYFKTSEQKLEAALTAHIACAHPHLTPPVIAWDAQENLLLTEDQSARLSETADLALWRHAVDSLARFQYTADGAVPRTLGCPVHTFNDLAERASRFLKDASVLESWGLIPEHIAGLQAYLPTIVAAHERVSRLALHLLPSHGDAHPMNVLIGHKDTGHRPVWFDWSDACLAHPLLDVGWFLAWTQHPGRARLPLRQHSGGAAGRLWQTYLEAARIPADPYGVRLHDAMLLALIHRALVCHERFAYWTGTLPDWRPRYVPFLLRSVLKLAC